MHVQRRAAAILVAVALAAAAVAGCGSSSNTSSTSSSSSSSAAASTTAGSSSNASLIALAKKKVAQYESNTAPYPGPTTAFNPGHYNAAVMGCPFSIAICQQQATISVQAIKAMGWSSGPPQQFSSPSDIAAFLERAAQQHLAGVVMWAVPLNTVVSAAEAAIKAGVIIVCPNCDSPKSLQATGKEFDVAPSWFDQGEINGWAQLARTGTATKSYPLYDTEFQSAVEKASGEKALINKECPSCTVNYVPFLSASAAQPGPPAVTALLAKDPKGTITDIASTTDSISLPIARTLASSSRTEICSTGYDGTPAAIAAVATQNPAVCDVVAESSTYDDWAAVDIMGRVKAGKPVWKNYDDMPSTLIEESNAKKYLDGLVPPGNWKQNLEKLWGAS